MILIWWLCRTRPAGGNGVFAINFDCIKSMYNYVYIQTFAIFAAEHPTSSQSINDVDAVYPARGQALKETQGQKKRPVVATAPAGDGEKTIKRARGKAKAKAKAATIAASAVGDGAAGGSSENQPAAPGATDAASAVGDDDSPGAPSADAEGDEGDEAKQVTIPESSEVGDGAKKVRSKNKTSPEQMETAWQEKVGIRPY